MIPCVFDKKYTEYKSNGTTKLSANMLFLDNIVINYSDHYIYSNYSDVYYKYSDLITESFMTY